MNASLKIALIGCGKMGSALLRGWLDNNIDADFRVIEPHDIPFNNIDHFRDTAEGSKDLAIADIIILAVKPQIMAEICNNVQKHLSKETLILSIAAGQSISSFETYFGASQPIIRSMPNLPASIGKGISVMLANKNVSDDQKQQASTLLETAGKVEWLEDENLLDAVTALSGSGPAYVFHLIETLTAAGIETGLSPELAETLARQTVIGSAALAETENQVDAATLRQNVTSPGGGTEAALKILMDGRIQNIYDEALATATKRYNELNS